jgi:DDE superfamily endonuclease
MNLQVIASPGGDVLWVSGPLPGSVHDKKAEWIWGVLAELEAAGLIVLTDKGYQGAAHAKVPYKGKNKPESRKEQRLADEPRVADAAGHLEGLLTEQGRLARIVPVGRFNAQDRQRQRDELPVTEVPGRLQRPFREFPHGGKLPPGVQRLDSRQVARDVEGARCRPDGTGSACPGPYEAGQPGPAVPG